MNEEMSFHSSGKSLRCLSCHQNMSRKHSTTSTEKRTTTNLIHWWIMCGVSGSVTQPSPSRIGLCSCFRSVQTTTLKGGTIESTVELTARGKFLSIFSLWSCTVKQRTFHWLQDFCQREKWRESTGKNTTSWMESCLRRGKIITTEW